MLVFCENSAIFLCYFYDTIPYLLFKMTMKSENLKIRNRQCKVFRISQQEILMTAESHDNQMNDSRTSVNFNSILSK